MRCTHCYCQPLKTNLFTNLDPFPVKIHFTITFDLKSYITYRQCSFDPDMSISGWSLFCRAHFHKFGLLKINQRYTKGDKKTYFSKTTHRFGSHYFSDSQQKTVTVDGKIFPCRNKTSKHCHLWSTKRKRK